MIAWLKKIFHDCRNNIVPSETGISWENYQPWTGDCCYGKCKVCGRTFDWYCPTSPTHLCEYDEEKDPARDFCLWCDGPEDRK